jgi:hypothetical protein
VPVLAQIHSCARTPCDGAKHNMEKRSRGRSPDRLCLRPSVSANPCA